MTPPNFLSYFSERLDNSTKVLALVIVTVALTLSAILLSAGFVQERHKNELNNEAQRYTLRLQEKIKVNEEHIQSVATLESANSFVEFGRRAKRLMEENPSYARIELRDETGMLLGQRESATSKEIWSSNLRQQLPPSVLLNFLRANEQQKIYWANSHSPSGQSAAEMIVPSKDTKSLWLIRIDHSYWLPPRSGIDLDPNIQVTLSEQPPLNSNLSTVTSLDLPGIKSHLLFTYVTPSDYSFDSMSLLLACMGLVLCFLVINYAWDAKRHRLARETITRQEMALVKQSQLSTMGEVSTALAHELNQPLATIANYVAACEMRVKSQGYEDPVLLDALTNARKQAMRAGEVVQSIRNYLKRRPNMLSTVDVQDMLEGLQPILMLSAKEHKTKLTVQSEKNLCARIDPALLEQVVLNLTRNGLDAMVDVDVSARKLAIHAYTHTSRNGSVWMRIDVADVGHGVDEANTSRLFESFFTTKEDGMGIGLSLCRSVAESYGGRIRWHNNPDGGATFSLLLPRVDTA